MYLVEVPDKGYVGYQYGIYVEWTRGIGPYDWEITWGEGTSDSGSSAEQFNNVGTSHVYSSAGSYELVITVTDAGIPETGRASKTVIVELGTPPPPPPPPPPTQPILSFSYASLHVWKPDGSYVSIKYYSDGRLYKAQPMLEFVKLPVESKVHVYVVIANDGESGKVVYTAVDDTGKTLRSRTIDPMEGGGNFYQPAYAEFFVPQRDYVVTLSASSSGNTVTMQIAVYPPRAVIKVNGKCMGGHPKPSMLLEIYLDGVMLSQRTITSDLLVTGQAEPLGAITYTPGAHTFYGRMVLTNPLGSYEFLTSAKTFTLG